MAGMLALDKAAMGTKQAKGQISLVGQVDALIDMLYFTYGNCLDESIERIFDIVHQANMGK